MKRLRILGVSVLFLSLACVSSASAFTGRYHLGTQRATFYMDVGLHRHFPAFERSRARVRCNHRLAKDRLRCDIGFAYGDSIFVGKGQIWVSYQVPGRPIWNYSYRLREINEYCVIVQHEPVRRCTTKHVVR